VSTPVGPYLVQHPEDWDARLDVVSMAGVTLTDVVVDRRSNAVLFVADDGRAWIMVYGDDYGSAAIEDVVGDPADLIGVPLLGVEESTSDDPPPDADRYDSYTWTFYRFATVKGDMDLRWLGSSNGYYSEEASLFPVKALERFSDPLGHECAQVVAHLHTSPRYSTPLNTLAANTGLDRETVAVVLDRLLELGAVRNAGDGWVREVTP